MLNAKLLATLSLGFLAAACVNPYDQQASTPDSRSRPPAMSTSERNCFDYGFAVGTSAYDRCVQREARSREAGRVQRGYAEARLMDDARHACSEYGLERGTQRYDNCVSREAEARRYREHGETLAPATQGYAKAAPTQLPDGRIVIQRTN